MVENVLEISNLTIGYSKPLVKNINCFLTKGEFVVLFGANGAGKSTLVKTILQHQPSLSGNVTLNKTPLDLYSNLTLAKQIAIVSTNTQFDLSLTVYDILALGRIPYLNLLGKLKENDISIINKYIETLELTKLINQLFYSLSDGQKQKVLIARALIQNTPLIILDEPTVHLDVKNRMLIFKLLKKITKEVNKTVICATHEIDFALKNSTNVWLIDKDKNFISDSSMNVNTEKIYSKLF